MLKYVLFGAFIVGYTAVLKVDSIIAWVLQLSKDSVFPEPWTVGAISVGILLPIIIVLDRSLEKSLPSACSRSDYLQLQLLLLLSLFFIIGISTDSNEYFTLERRTARLCAAGHYKEALQIGKEFSTTTPTLVALRTFAMTKIEGNGEATYLADHFFEYPLPHNANAAMLVLDSTNKAIAPFYSRMVTPLHCEPQDSLTITNVIRHKRLIGYLIERKLSAFAQELVAHHSSDVTLDALPTVYQEALLLYQRKTSNPITSIHFENHPTEANYQDYLDLRKQVLANPLIVKSASKVAEGNLMRSLYKQTYWFYHDYNLYFHL